MQEKGGRGEKKEKKAQADVTKSKNQKYKNLLRADVPIQETYVHLERGKGN